MIEPASGRAGRPAALARVCRELSQRGADQGAAQHVGRVVDTEVDARVGDGGGEGVQRYGGRRQDAADAGRERGGRQGEARMFGIAARGARIL